MHLSHSQVYSPSEQTKCHLQPPPPPPEAVYGVAMGTLVGSILPHRSVSVHPC